MINSGWENTVTNLGPGLGNQQVTRLGPGVPAGTTAGPGAPTAEQVWRQGLPGSGPGRNRARRPVVSTAVSVILLIASGVAIFLRLHHPAFGVTGVAITGPTRPGCSVNVTGRIDTTGGSGTVSYEWVFQPQLSAPQPLRQSVSAGQAAVYVTASVEGSGHGRMGQAVTLKVLSPGQVRETSTNLTVSC